MPDTADCSAAMTCMVSLAELIYDACPHQRILPTNRFGRERAY